MSNASTRNAHQELNRALSLESLFSVAGLVAVVTGGGTGIGMMFTEALATHGAKVYITGRREEVLKKAVDHYQNHVTGQIIAIQGDVTCKADLERVVKEIESQESNGIQILINNAGILGPTSDTVTSISGQQPDKWTSKLELENFEDWDKVWRTNVSATYFLTISLLPLLQKGSNKDYRSGVINISSARGMLKVSPAHVAYSASKAASIHLTKILGTEVGKLGIRFNCIAPGIFPSELTGKTPCDNRGKNDITGEFDLYKDMIPAGRPGKPEDMAATVLYLCGKGGQYCDGLIMNVDGGALLTNPSTY